MVVDNTSVVGEGNTSVAAAELGLSMDWLVVDTSEEAYHMVAAAGTQPEQGYAHASRMNTRGLVIHMDRELLFGSGSETAVGPTTSWHWIAVED